jgi:hypothetical protein
MNLFLFLVCSVLVVASTTAASFLDAYVDTYKEILLSFAEEEHRILGKDFDRNSHELIVTVESLKKLLQLHDSDAKCGRGCQTALIHYVTKNGVPFGIFEKTIRAIYGDQISEDPYMPQELHLALTADSTKMNIMWVTMEALDKPVVQYLPQGESDWAQAMSGEAVTSTYTVPKKWWPVFTGTIYTADMPGLENDKSYTYRVGGYSAANATMRYSDAYTFKAAPADNNDPNRRTVTATFADHGTFELLGFKTVDKLVEMYGDTDDTSGHFDFVHVSGDLSYAGLDSPFEPLNITKDDEFEHIWDLLGVQNQPVSATVPWMTSNGNHESFYDWAAYKARFNMPTGGEQFWYTYQYGNAQWVSLDSEADLSPESDQIVWLESTLEAANANRANVPWVVATLHKPLYCSCTGTPGGYADKLEAIFNKYSVDLVTVGHMHAYERIHPVAAGQVLDTGLPTSQPWGQDGATVDVYSPQGKGPVQVVQGNSGGMQAESWDQPAPAWSGFRCANGFVPKDTAGTRDILADITEMVEVGVDLEGKLDGYHYSDT